jgi:hypothetical protein
LGRIGHVAEYESRAFHGEIDDLDEHQADGIEKLAPAGNQDDDDGEDDLQTDAGGDLSPVDGLFLS